jgi:hypothetical protein
VIVSRFSKPCDTIDGSEQRYGSNSVNVTLATDSGRCDRRWEDDGGSAADAAPQTAAADDAAKKPTWSVQSLRHLLCAIRASQSSAIDADGSDRESPLVYQSTDGELARRQTPGYRRF